MANPYDNLNTNTPQGRAAARAGILSGNPDDAMRNAMLDAGFNPYVRNPFIQRLLGAGRGLSMANAIESRNMSPDEIASAGGEGAILQRFLRDALTGGSVFSQLASSAASVPGVLDDLTRRANEMAEGGITADQANPFLEILGAAFGDPNAAQGAMSALYGPVLGPNLGRAYQSQIGDIMDSRLRLLADDPDTYAGENRARNFWEYIFQNIRPGSNPGRGRPASLENPPKRGRVGAATGAGGNVQ